MQIALATLPNLRDLGRWPTEDGRRVRSGLLFRSTALDGLAAADLGAVARLNLRTVIDLRTEDERLTRPDRIPAGVTQLICDVLADSINAAPAQLPKVLADPGGASRILGDGRAEALLENGYCEIVSLPSALDAYRRLFNTLATDSQLPLLFHCSTGKDRTGWAAAVILTFLGVSKEDVMREYMLTNHQLLPALQPVMEKFRTAGGDPQLLQSVLGVRAEYLEAAFAEMRKKFGSLEGYLADGLNLDAPTRERLREKLSEEVAS